MNIITVTDLSKEYKIIQRDSGFINAIKSFIKRKYRIVKAVDSVSFKIKKGEIVGYIGPNGAGKSTTIKMLSGILKPDHGEIRILGMNPFDDRIKYVKEIGVVFGQKSQLWWDIPAEESFDLLKDIYKIPDEEYEKNKKELVEILHLEDIIKSPVRQLSLGERMKCELVASLLHNPKILFLDEPTIGLDAISKVIVRDFIKRINKEKKVTIILTTHDMADIETLTDRLIVIGHGKKLYDGSVESIKNEYSNEKIVEIVYEELKKIPKIKNTEIISNEGGILRIKIDTRYVKVSDITYEYSKVCEIKDINVLSEGIDEIIYKLYTELAV
ncbi:MAG: ATP-binding cassette domain-containing protein [Bacilli bacterium]